MVPFHPLRHEARVRAARALASVATFCVIAVVLLGGSVGDEGATSASAAPGDPVLATPAQVAAQAAPPPEEAPPTEEPLPPPVEEPTVPPVEQPPAGETPPPVEEPPAGETPPPTEEPAPVDAGRRPAVAARTFPAIPSSPTTPPVPDPD